MRRFDRKGGLGQSLFMLSLIISIFLYLGGVRVFNYNLSSGNQDLLGGMFNLGSQPTLTSDVMSKIPQNPQTNTITNTGSASGAGNVYGLVDGLNLVFYFIVLLFNFFAAELSLLNVPGMNIAFVYMIAVPIVFGKVLAVITFIRGIWW